MASGPELAHAYVAVSLSTGGLGKDLTKQLTGSEGSSAAEKSGSALGAKLASGMKKAMKVGVGGVVAALGYSISKGFSRLSAIDQATAKLRGLGNSAKGVDSIMSNALASVKGTAFGLDEAVTVAASLTASGIKSGKDLTGVLKTVADTATISGRSMADVGAIFGSVAAKGKLQGDDMLQLMSAGVPVLQFLSKQLGKSTADVSAMASKGKIDFKTFSEAMKAGLGGAALASGNTFQGAFANMKAAMGRFGAALLKGIFPATKTGLNGMTKFFDKLTDSANKFGDWSVGAIDRASKAIQSLRNSMFRPLQNARADILLLLHGDSEDGEGGWPVALHDSIVKYWGKSKHVLLNWQADALLVIHGDSEDGEGGWPVALHASIVKYWGQAKHVMQNWRADALLLIHGDQDDGENGWPVQLHNQIVTAFAKSKVAVKDFQGYLSETLADAPKGVTLSWGVIFQNAVGGLASSVSGGLRKAQAAFQKASPKIRTTIADTFSLPPGTAESWGALLNAGWDKATTALGKLGTDVWSGIKTFLNAARPGFEKLWAAIKPLASDIGPAIKNLLPILNPFTLLFKTLRPLLPDIAQTLGEIASSIGGFLASAIRSAKPLLDAILGAFSRLMPFVQKLVASLLPPLADLFKSLSPMLDAIFKALEPVVDLIAQGLIKAIEILEPIVRRVFGVFAEVIKGAIKAISGIVDFITGIFTGNWSKAWDGVKKIFSGFWDGIKAVGGLLLDWIGKIPGLIISLIGKGAKALGKLGLDLMGWIWDGIKNVAKNVWSWFTSLPGTVISKVGTGSSKLLQLGKDLLTWIWNGIKNVATSVWTWFTNLAATVISKVGAGASKLLQLGKDILTWIWNGIKNVATSVWNWFLDLPGNIIKWVGLGIVALFGLGVKLIGWIWDGIKSAAKSVWSWFGDIGSAIGGAIGKAWQALKDVGATIVRAIRDGIAEAWHFITDMFSKNLPSDMAAFVAGTTPVVQQLKAAWAAINAVNSAMSVARGIAAGFSFHAAGGALDPGWNVVGEQGPELIHKQGDRAMVYSNPQSRRMLANAAPAVQPDSNSSGVLTGNLYLSDGEFLGKVRGTVQREVTHQIGMAEAR